MSGSGARDGFGSPPWDPADPVPHPDLDDTQALPGLGSIPGPGRPGPAARSPEAAPAATGPAASAARARRRLRGNGRPAHGRPGPRRASAARRAPTRRARPRQPWTGRRRRRRATDAGAGSGSAARAGRQAPPQLLARASGAHRRRAGARAAHQVVRRPGLLHPVRLDGEHPRNRRPGADQQDRVSHRGRSTAATSSCSTAPGRGTVANAPTSSNIFSKAVSELEGIVGISHDSSIYIKRVIGRARRPRGLLQRQGPGHRQRGGADRELLPVPGQRSRPPSRSTSRSRRAASG